MKIKPVQPLFLPALCTALGAATLAAVLFLQASNEAQRVRQHTETLAREALAIAGHRWARFEIADDEGRLLGEAPDPRDRDAALRAVRRVLTPAMAWPAVFRTLKDGTRPAAAAVQGVFQRHDAAVRCREQVDAALGGRRILFEFGSSRLTAESRRLLGVVAAIAQACPATRLAVQGHTDAIGQPALNLRLSQQRAQAVVAALVEAGVPAERLQPLGLGASRPLALGRDPAAQALNRRIEFHWTAEGSADHAA